MDQKVVGHTDSLALFGKLVYKVSLWSQAVVQWSFGLIWARQVERKTGNAWYFSRCIGAIRAGPVPLRSGKNLGDTQKIMGTSVVYFTTV